MKPQDILLSVNLALAPLGSKPTLVELSKKLGLSVGEVHSSVRRATDAGLLGPERAPNRAALREFLVHGLKYVFPARRGPITRGIPTAHAAMPLSRELGESDAPPPVWPDPDGPVRGETFVPLYPSVPHATRHDPALYQVLSVLDALRGGRARERALATKYIETLFA